MEGEPKLCIVTSFMDIGRDEWKVYSRTVDEYFLSFLPYLRLDHDIIVFMDDRYVEKLRALLSADYTPANIVVVPINWEWMAKNIHAYGKLEMEKKIMDTDHFKRIIAHRRHCPETYCAEYNIMQHAKIDFVCYAIDNKLSNAGYFAWSDFGYFKTVDMAPKKGTSKLDLSKFKLDRINFQTINPVSEDDKNILYTMRYAPEKIGGFFHLGSENLLKEYQKLYHNTYDSFHRIGLVDDDQHFMVQCYFKRMDLFHLWDLGGWHKIYTVFCV